MTPSGTYLIVPGPWSAYGTCTQMNGDLWFPEPGADASLAKELCAECPVLTQCREYALRSEDEYGVMGGLTARQRRDMRAEMRRAGELPPREPAPIRHGTAAGARAHHRRGETSCPACSRAAAFAKAEGGRRKETAA